MMTGIAMLMLLLQATGGGGGGGRPVATPVGNPGEWFSTDNYPPDAIRKGEEGRVVYFVNIDTSGTPTACYILTSSGSSSLDSGTCAVVMAKGHFKPAHDAAGKAVASTWSSAVRWEIPESSVIGPPVIDLSHGSAAQYDETIEISLDPDGKVTACKATQPSNAVDPCADYSAGAQVSGPTVKDGKPVASVMTKKISLSIRAAD